VYHISNIEPLTLFYKLRTFQAFDENFQPANHHHMAYLQIPLALLILTKKISILLNLNPHKKSIYESTNNKQHVQILKKKFIRPFSEKYSLIGADCTSNKYCLINDNGISLNSGNWAVT
jgi:hypothetical protein